MTDERPDYDEPRRWMLLAESDLILAQQVPEGVVLEFRLFHAQQAVEKSLKAVLVARGLPFSRTHNIWELNDELRAGGIEVPEAAKSAEGFTDFATNARYGDRPVPEIAVTKVRCDIIAEIAAAVVAWAKSEIAKTAKK